MRLLLDAVRQISDDLEEAHDVRVGLGLRPARVALDLRHRRWRAVPAEEEERGPADLLPLFDVLLPVAEGDLVLLEHHCPVRLGHDGLVDHQIGLDRRSALRGRSRDDVLEEGRPLHSLDALRVPVLADRLGRLGVVRPRERGHTPGQLGPIPGHVPREVCRQVICRGNKLSRRVWFPEHVEPVFKPWRLRSKLLVRVVVVADALVAAFLIHPPFFFPFPILENISFFSKTQLQYHVVDTWIVSLLSLLILLVEEMEDHDQINQVTI